MMVDNALHIAGIATNYVSTLHLSKLFCSRFAQLNMKIQLNFRKQKFFQPQKEMHKQNMKGIFFFLVFVYYYFVVFAFVIAQRIIELGRIIKQKSETQSAVESTDSNEKRK